MHQIQKISLLLILAIISLELLNFFSGNYAELDAASKSYEFESVLMGVFIYGAPAFLLALRGGKMAVNTITFYIYVALALTGVILPLVMSGSGWIIVTTVFPFCILYFLIVGIKILKSLKTPVSNT